MDKTIAFLKDPSTAELIQNTLLEHRKRTTGNIKLSSILLEVLSNHVPKVAGVMHYATKIGLCKFKYVDDRFVLDHESIEDLGWFVSDSISGVMDSGFWNIDRLTSQMYSPSYSRYGLIPNPREKRMPSNESYKCAVSKPIPVLLDEDAVFLLEAAPKSGLYVPVEDTAVFTFLPK